jgi:hypothetical protein
MEIHRVKHWLKSWRAALEGKGASLSADNTVSFVT